MVKLSKRISKALRHKPKSLGLSLDEHGWARVDDLIAGLSETTPFNMEMLEYIVEENNKKRFSFNEDKTLIRANQGHTILVDVELPIVTPPDILYHGTGEKYVGIIKEEGLKPMDRLYVHISPDIETAVSVGSRHGKPHIFQVLSGKMHEDGYIFYRSVNGVWLTDKVPPQYLQDL